MAQQNVTFNNNTTIKIISKLCYDLLFWLYKFDLKEGILIYEF